MSVALEPWVEKNFKQFLTALNGGSVQPVHGIRLKAFDLLKGLGFPTPKLEDWKYTNISDSVKGDFALPSVTLAKPVSQIDISSFELPEIGNRLVFVNGFFQENLSNVEAIESSKVSSISAAMSGKAGPEMKLVVESHITKLSTSKSEAIDNLNTAFLRDGAVVYVPSNIKVSKPIQLIFVSSSTTDKILITPRILVVAEKSSEVSIVETHANLNEQNAGYFSAPVLEVFAEEQAQVDIYKVVLEGNKALHIGNAFIKQAKNSNVRFHAFNFGGSIVRNEVEVDLAGTNCNTTLNGLSVIGETQLVDNHTVLKHRMPHCESTERFKGVYAGKSKGVFNGTIIVSQDAQKTNAIQSNQSILLSKDATIDTKPQLKIWADDVKCTHGATVGQLDETAMFYLRSRGLGLEAARDILVHAFASDIVSGVKIPELKNRLEAELTKKLETFAV